MHILLFDDRELTRDVLKVYLESLHAEVRVFEAATPEAAIKAAKNAIAADLILVDLENPNLGGLDCLDRLGARDLTVPVALLSGTTSLRKVITAFRRGAAGVIPKTFSGHVLWRALQLIRAGERFVPASILDDASSAEIAAAGAEDMAQGHAPPLDSLTPRQWDVVALLAHGYSNKQIAERLHLQPITVATHLKSVYRKLNVSNRTQAAAMVMELGHSA